MSNIPLSAELNKSVLHNDWGKHAYYSAATLQLLEHHLGVGVWRLELPAGHIFASDRTFEIYGLEPTREPVSLRTVIDILVREDRRRAVDLLSQAIEQKCGYKYVLRINGPSGQLRIVECTADVEVNKAGDVVAVVGTARDISDIYHPAGAIVGRSLLLRALMKNVPAAIAILDSDMNYIAVSDYWAAGHGKSGAQELIGRNHYVEHPYLSDEVKREHRSVLAGSTLRRPRAYLKNAAGHPIQQTCVMAPWYDASGKVGGMMLMLSTVDQSNTLPKDKATTALPTKRELLGILEEVMAG
ncbi:PAS domain-containing protein [Pelagibacterium halotolerans]|uniref:PAS domain-containing protein n=1 Tax=Pelagibacterium halotolerans TaxID=531813 RepID=UPI00384D4BB6